MEAHVHLSKRLVKTLRHTAVKEGFHISDDGYIRINELLQHPLYQDLSLALIQTILATCPKQRLSLKGDLHSVDAALRANQGHSALNVQVVLYCIVSASDIPICIHGTYQRHMVSICNGTLFLLIRCQRLVQDGSTPYSLCSLT